MLKLGSYYAEAINRAGVEFDVIFGPAYKGIPLATTVAMCLSSHHGRNVDIAYNRKEAKYHGEGGNLVGAPVQVNAALFYCAAILYHNLSNTLTGTLLRTKGRRVLVIDDVITAGTAIRETMAILQPAGSEKCAPML